MITKSEKIDIIKDEIKATEKQITELQKRLLKLLKNLLDVIEMDKRVIIDKKYKL